TATDAEPQAAQQPAQAGEKAPQVADPRNDIADKPAAEPKSKAQARKEKDEARRQRTRDMLGAKEGDIVTPSADIGYSSAGESYRVISIGADGSVDVENVATGGRTQWSRSELAAATRRGVEFARQEAATGTDTAPAGAQETTVEGDARPEAGVAKAEPNLEAALKLLKEQKEAAGNKWAEGIVKRKIRALAKKTPITDERTVMALDIAATRFDMENLEFLEPAAKPEPAAEARSDKAELTPDDLDRIPFPLEAGYRIVSRPAKGSVVIAPRKIGALYTDDDFKALVAYAKPFGFTIMRHGEKKGYAYIIAPLERPYDWLDAFFS